MTSNEATCMCRSKYPKRVPSEVKNDLFTMFINSNKRCQDAFISGWLHLEMAVPPHSNKGLLENVKKQCNVRKYELSSK